MSDGIDHARLDRAELIHAALSRSLALAESLAFMSDGELLPAIRKRVDSYRDGVEELAKVLDETLSPALEAAGELLTAFKEENAA